MLTAASFCNNILDNIFIIESFELKIKSRSYDKVFFLDTLLFYFVYVIGKE